MSQRAENAAINEALDELAKEEETLGQADESLGTARGRYQLAAHRYAAVREVVEIMLDGLSPYAKNGPFWMPDGLMKDVGRYRYLFKGVGEAVLQALMDADGPLDLPHLRKALRRGGLETDLRAVNASLLKMNGVRKNEDGTYEIDEW